MTIQARLVVSGSSAAQAVANVGTVADQLTATGTTQGTAYVCGADYNRFTTVASGSGAILPSLNPGDYVTVINAGANALKLYPPVGGQINGLGANNAYSIATTTGFCEVCCINPLQYHALQSA